MIAHGSKHGIHSLQGSAMHWVNKAHEAGVAFPVVKGVNDLDWLINVKKLWGDKTITIARYAANEGAGGEGMNGIHNATNYQPFVDAVMEPIRRRINANPELKQYVDYWEAA